VHLKEISDDAIDQTILPLLRGTASAN